MKNVIKIDKKTYDKLGHDATLTILREELRVYNETSAKFLFYRTTGLSGHEIRREIKSGYRIYKNNLKDLLRISIGKGYDLEVFVQE